MTFKALKREHPGRVCVCRPHLRDASNNRVVSWICLRTFDNLDAAKAALKRFKQNGVTDAVLISTTTTISIEEELAVDYFMVFLGMKQ